MEAVVAFPVVVTHVLPGEDPALPPPVVMEIAWLLEILMFASVFPTGKMAAVPTMNVVLEDACMMELVTPFKKRIY